VVRAGMRDVVPAPLFALLTSRELETRCAGSAHVDVAMLRRHTEYSGGYSDDHPVVRNFWRVLDSFSLDQQRKLLKFVTSCSRAPLLGFAELTPRFAIRNAGDSSRLPTSSTCINLLKLPSFETEVLMKQKLLYAINSGAGFDLS